MQHAGRATADLVYATATYAAASFASSVSRTPLVAKLVSDPAYERARRYGLFDGTLEEFQEPGGAKIEALKRARSQALRRAGAIVVPSAYLAAITSTWGLDRSRVSVLPNPAPDIDVVAEPLEPGTFVFVGRLTRAKALDVAIAAIARVPDARLVLIGDGPDRDWLEGLAHDSGASDRIVFRGSLPRARCACGRRRLRGGLLTSAWENFPHSAVEALAVGVPVVATAVGGVPEIVQDGVNGLLAPVGDVDAVAGAMSRIMLEPRPQEPARSGSRTSIAELSVARVYGRLESVLDDGRTWLIETRGSSLSDEADTGSRLRAGWRRSGTRSKS